MDIDARTLAERLAQAPGHKSQLDKLTDLMPVIEQARARKVAWQTIAREVFVAGLTREDGQPLSAAHLAALVGRHRDRPNAGRRSAAPAPTPSVRSPTPPSAENPEKKSVDLDAILGETNGPPSRMTSIDDFLNGERR